MKRWEVYREIPPAWTNPDLHVIRRAAEGPYARCWTYRGARKMAAIADWALRNGRPDTDFAAFKIRKVTR